MKLSKNDPIMTKFNAPNQIIYKSLFATVAANGQTDTDYDKVF